MLCWIMLISVVLLVRITLSLNVLYYYFVIIEYSYGGHPLTNSGVFSMLPRDSAYLGENYSYKLVLFLFVSKC